MMNGAPLLFYNKRRIMFNLSNKFLIVISVDIAVRSLSIAYAERLLKWLAENVNSSIEKHIHFWQLWLKSLLMEYGYQIKLNRAANLTSLTALQQRLSDYTNQIAKL